MRFVAALLMTLSLGLVSPAAAQSKFYTVDANMKLTTAANTAPGINHLQFTLTLLNGTTTYTGSDNVKTTVATSTGITSFLVEVHPVSGLIVRGLKQVSGTSDSENMLITCTPRTLLGDITVTGTGLGGSPQTPSGNYETVSSGAYDATKHNTRFNKGTIETKVGTTTQAQQNLASSPLVYPGSGNGAVSVVENAALKSGFYRNYTITVTQPLNSSQPITPVSGTFGTTTGSMFVKGSVVGTGSVTVEVKPALEVQPPVVGVGVPVKIKGINGEVVKLMAGDSPSTITRWVNDSTYTIGAVTANEVTVTDAGAIGKAKQFYAVVAGP